MTKSKAKICLVSISLGRGGLERSVAMLSEMLVDKGYEVHIVILNDEIRQSYKGHLFNLGTFKTTKDNLLKRLIRFKKLRKFLKEQNFNIIIDHRPKNNYWREQFYSEFIYRGFKNIYVVHSYFLEEYFCRNFKLKKIYADNMVNITVSEEIKNKIVAETNLKNFEVIQNAFDPDWQKSSIKIEVEGDYLLSLGRLDDEIKNFSFLIKAYKDSILPEKGLKLVILGDGKHKTRLKQLVHQLEADKEIIFIAHADSPFSYLKRAKFVALTSRYEGFPMVLVESLSLGTPVVSVDCKSGPREIVQHEKNGLLVPQNDQHKFTEALNRMVEDEVLYENCKANAANSIERFSKEKIADKWDRLINQHIKP